MLLIELGSYGRSQLKRLASAVQLRPWPPSFQAFSFPITFSSYGLQPTISKNRGLRRTYATAFVSTVSSCRNTQP